MNMEQKVSTWKGVIYQLLSPSRKVYVGQTIKTLEHRLLCHKQRARKKHHPLYDAIRKYGWENFTVRVLCECYSQEDLDLAEQFFIQYYESLVPKGYNIALGGGDKNYWKHFDDEKKSRIGQKLSKSLKQAFQTNPHLREQRRLTSTGRLWTEEKKERHKRILSQPEVKEKRSISQRLARSSPEQRRRISERAKKALNTLEAKQNMSIAQLRVWSDPEIHQSRCESRRSDKRKFAETQFSSFCSTHQRFTRQDLQDFFGLESGIAGKLIRKGYQEGMIRPWTFEEQLQLRKSSWDRMVVYFVTDSPGN